MAKRSRMWTVTLLVGCVSIVALAAAKQPAIVQPVKKVVFGRDILPILSDKCFKCHGPDANTRMAGMRLDTAEGAFADRGGRWAIVPGKPEDSLLIKRINDADSPMPPQFSGKSLTQGEKDLLKRWIAEGAQYGKLWSFEPLPVKIPVPETGSPWPKEDIDKFVLHGLQENGLSPNPEAPKARWLRRVTLDLIGLPPTEEEIKAFEKDTSQNAFDRVVDRLLASPHFGERVAVDWLDAARYSDSYGYQSDLLMPTWPYRDWVVNSINENLPYDQFLVDQIAGDLLPNPTRGQKLATAFNRLHRQSNEGGSIAAEFKTEYAVDRVSTFGTAVLGLTVGCARCHDHKFDPITQREFYQLYAYFNSIDEYGLLLSSEIVPTPSLLLPTPEQESRLKELQDENEKATQTLAMAKASAPERFKAWRAKADSAINIPGLLCNVSFDDLRDGKYESTLPDGKAAEPIGKVEIVDGHQGKAVQLDGDNGIIVRGLPSRERWEPFTWSFWIKDPRQTEPVVLLHRAGGTDVGFCGFDLMLENGYLTARVMRHWPGNAVAIKTTRQVEQGSWQNIAWTWDGTGRASGLKLYLNGKLAPSEVLADKLWKKINAYGDLGGSGGEWAFGQRFRDAGFKGGAIDDIVFSSRALSSLEIERLYDGKDVLRTDADIETTFEAAFDTECQSALKNVQKAQADLTNFEETILEISVMEDSKKEIPAFVLARGQYDAPKTDETRVVRGVPHALPPLDESGENNRLSLAKWAVRDDNPLTARVAVNRFWQMMFGTGLVETTENFGVQGSQPSNPELLDFLARKFIDSGWNVKKLIRDIALSATYRQESAMSAKPSSSVKVNVPDPMNRLLSRGPSNRLSAEMVRDTALAAAGLLNDKVGGPPVNPYQPKGIWQENNVMSPAFVQSKGADLYRRSIYSTWKRTTPVPSMMLFDATSREACTMRRPTTNTPLQALVLLNDVQFVEAARVLAELVLNVPGTDESRVSKAFLRLAGRNPDKEELAILIKTLDEQREAFATDMAGALKLVSLGEKQPDPKLRATEVASMTIVVQTILNSDAVVWKR